MAFVIQNLRLTPTSFYAGPVDRWVTVIGSAIQYSTQALAQAVIDAYGMYAIVNTNPAKAIFSMLQSVQVITTTGAGVYTPTAGTSYIELEMCGGGGGGGGCASPTGTNVGLSGGGGGGGYLRKFITANFSGAAINVGAGGAGGVAGNNAGTAGGNTTFTLSGGAGTVFTANGGNGGLAGATGAAPQSAAGNNGGATTNGDLGITGESSKGGFITTQTSGLSSGGGGCPLGFGAPPATNPNLNVGLAGNAAAGFGGGGAGVIINGTAPALAGGNGKQGVMIIREYT